MRLPRDLDGATFVAALVVCALLGVLVLIVAFFGDDGEFTHDQAKRQIETAWATDIGDDFEVVQAEWSTAGGDSSARYTVAVQPDRYEAATARFDLATWTNVDGRYTVGVNSGPNWESGISASPSTLELGYDYRRE